ncbi:MAG: tetratricopeptide repeat protein [Bryobacteraceae bacterium]
MSTQSPATTVPVTSKLALIAVIALVIAALSTIDKFLADAQQRSDQRLAHRSYVAGLRLLNAGKANEAVEAFRKAHALDRGNMDYEVDLITALTAAGKLDRAELLTKEVLERDPNDGRANLAAAHLMIKRGRIADAESYYHRAVYGDWPDNPAAHRVSVRMELADFLAAHGEGQELLAELLPLQEEAGKDPATLRHLARLFLVAGAPTRAADEYRVLIKQNHNDGAAYAGLGRAELQSGEYQLAHEAFLAAAARTPNDPSIRRELDLASTLEGLDPTSRKLTSTEKYRRSRQILDLARSDLQRCATSHAGTNSSDAGQLLASAGNLATSKMPATINNEMAEGVLSLAEKLWQARFKICGASASPDEEPLRLIVEKLARQPQ